MSWSDSLVIFLTKIQISSTHTDWLEDFDYTLKKKKKVTDLLEKSMKEVVMEIESRL